MIALLTDFSTSPYLLPCVLATLAIVLVATLYNDISDELPYRRFPLVGKGRWEITNRKAKNRFLTSARELISQGFSQGVRVFQLRTPLGPLLVLHPQYVNELKSHTHVSFTKAMQKLFLYGKYRGLASFGQGDQQDIFQTLVQGKLTQSLGQVTLPLSKETAALLRETFPYSEEWKPYVFAQTAPYMVARLSSLVFLGDKICRDKEWLDVSVNYALDAFSAVRALRLWPSILRPFVQWFLPETRRAQKHLTVARRIIQREIEQRRREEALGHKRSSSDALDWAREVAAGRPFDETLGQIGLSVAAIHTTSQLLTNIIYDLAAYPEYVAPLREEIKTVLQQENGWKASALTKMKLLDSVMKETQRLNPAAPLNRLVMKDITLSDGTVLPKGASVAISSHPVMTDASIYEDPERYDGRRFWRKRQEPGNEHRYQFVTTSPEHLGFGHGQHACPGRFFAANEIKIVLAHLLMKYDWTFADKDRGRPKTLTIGTENIVDPTVVLLFKSRKPEIDLFE
ncbi:hypothetical protein VTN96DRAFT_1228 [Rasamsonia emersonii]